MKYFVFLSKFSFSETQIILNLLKEQMHNGAILKKSPERRSN